MDTRKVQFFGKEIEVDAAFSTDQIRDALKSMFPQIENATPEFDDEGNVSFVVRAGTKGNSDVRKVSFFGKEIEVDASFSTDQIRDALKSMFPQIENATPEFDDEGNVSFVVRAGTKGLGDSETRKVSFFGKEIEVDAAFSTDQIRDALKSMFPQIENATPEFDDEGNVSFVVRAGTKG